MKVFLFAATILALISGCASFEIIESQSAELAVAELAIGDAIQILTRDGDEIRFSLEAIEDDVLIGDDTRILIADIRTISVKRATGDAPEIVGGTIGLILGIGLLVALGL